MQRRGFSLVELMVASSMGIVILIGATAVASAMMRAARQTQEVQSTTSRGLIARGLMTPLLSGLGYGWVVEGAATWPTPDTQTGTFGEGYCAPQVAGFCPTTGNIGIYPLQIDNSTTAGDEIRGLIPRDTTLEALTINALGTGAVIPDSCTSLSASQAFDVTGTTTSEWAAGDLVLISKAGHVTVSNVVTALAAGGGAAVTRDLTLNMGTAANLQYDDGGSTTACNATSSLTSAKVFRIAQVRMRLSATTDAAEYASGQGLQALEFAYSVNTSQVAAPTFTTVVSDVDDLQFQLQVLQVPKTDVAGTASTCVCNGSAALAGAVFSCGTTPAGSFPICPATKGLNDMEGTDTVYNLMGLRVGLLLRGDLTTNRATRAWTGLFDRTGTVVTDAKQRQVLTFYIGYPNAYAL